MKQAEIVKKWKSISEEDLAKEIEEKGKYRVLADYAEIMDKRTYFKVSPEGELRRKEANPILYLYPYEREAHALAKLILDYGNPVERQVIHKIDRLSNLDQKSLEEKCMTTMVHGNFDYAKRYAKELYCRDAEKFWDFLSLFVSLGKLESKKKEVFKAFRLVMSENSYDESLFHLYLSYLVRFKDWY